MCINTDTDKAFFLHETRFCSWSFSNVRDLAGNFDTFRNFVVVGLWLLEAKLNVDIGILLHDFRRPVENVTLIKL
jgi:hypothetical protein